MIYVVRRNAYVHGQKLEDNFTNNGIYKSGKNSQNPQPQYTQMEPH